MNSQYITRLWMIVKREYTERVFSRAFLISNLLLLLVVPGAILLPVLLDDGISGAMSSPVVNDSTPAPLEDYRTALYNINVLDATTSGVGERIAQLIGGGKYANQPMPLVRVTAPEDLAQAESTAVRETLDSRISGYLVIDSTTLINGAAAYSGRKANIPSAMRQVREAISGGLVGHRLHELGLSEPQIDSITIIDPQLAVTPVRSQSELSLGDEAFFYPLILTFLITGLIIGYSHNVLTSVVEEKASRASEIILTSVKPSQLLGGKIIGVAAVGFTQQLLFIGFLLAFLSIAFPALLAKFSLGPGWAVWGIYISFTVLGMIFYSALNAAAGSFADTEADARHLGAPIIYLFMASFFTMSFIADKPDSTMAVIASILPFSSPLIMPIRMGLTQVPANQILLSIGVLLVASVATLKLAARVYRANILMYGKKFNYREIMQAIRGY